MPAQPLLVLYVIVVIVIVAFQMASRNHDKRFKQTNGGAFNLLLLTGLIIVTFTIRFYFFHFSSLPLLMLCSLCFHHFINCIDFTALLLRAQLFIIPHFRYS